MRGYLKKNVSNGFHKLDIQQEEDINYCAVYIQFAS
jgi:hypothetical protein